LRVCWRRVLDEDRPRIVHECTNGRLAVRVFVVLFVDGCLLCGRGGAGVVSSLSRHRVTAGADGFEKLRRSHILEQVRDRTRL